MKKFTACLALAASVSLGLTACTTSASSLDRITASTASTASAITADFSASVIAPRVSVGTIPAPVSLQTLEGAVVCFEEAMGYAPDGTCVASSFWESTPGIILP